MRETLRLLIELGGLIVAIGTFVTNLSEEDTSPTSCHCAEADATAARPAGALYDFAPVLPGPRFREQSPRSDREQSPHQSTESRSFLRQLVSEAEAAEARTAHFP